MQLVHLPYLRQASQVEADRLLSLPVFTHLNTGSEETTENLLVQFFYLFQDIEKQILPYFAKLHRDEFDWIKWLVSPKLASLLVTRFHQLPQPLQAASISMQPSSLPQALGSAWAVLLVHAQLAYLLPSHSSQVFDTGLLEQLEGLVAIYCLTPEDFLTVQQSAKSTLLGLGEAIQAWPLEVLDSTPVQQMSA